MGRLADTKCVLTTNFTLSRSPALYLMAPPTPTTLSHWSSKQHQSVTTAHSLSPPDLPQTRGWASESHQDPPSCQPPQLLTIFLHSSSKPAPKRSSQIPSSVPYVEARGVAGISTPNDTENFYITRRPQTWLRGLECILGSHKVLG